MDEHDDLSELHNQKQEALERKEAAEADIAKINENIEQTQEELRQEHERDSSDEQGGDSSGIF
jgi:predicted  nucleic acid-binding Zn-ribbon protein